MAVNNQFYVYVIFRPNGIPCYVGKGRGTRWLQHEKLGKRHHNKHLANIIANAGGDVPKVKIRQNLTNEQACEIEIALIRVIGRECHGGPLVNLTDGGEGAPGIKRVVSAETKEKLRISHLGKKQSAETKEKRAAKNRGKKRSAEFCIRMSIVRRGEKRSIETRQNMNRAKIGMKLSAAHRLKIKLGTIKALASPEVRQKIRDASLATWAKRREHLAGE